MGPVERTLTPDELARLHAQATYHGWSDEEFTKLTMNEALDYLFQRI
jgi:hypothetical protein